MCGRSCEREVNVTYKVGGPATFGDCKNNKLIIFATFCLGAGDCGYFHYNCESCICSEAGFEYARTSGCSINIYNWMEVNDYEILKKK